MTFTSGNGINPLPPPEWFKLVPLFCDECDWPIGRAAAGVLPYLKENLCSDKCRVLAEWHAPERR